MPLALRLSCKVWGGRSLKTLLSIIDFFAASFSTSGKWKKNLRCHWNVKKLKCLIRFHESVTYSSDWLISEFSKINFYPVTLRNKINYIFGWGNHLSCPLFRSSPNLLLNLFCNVFITEGNFGTWLC